MKLVIFFIATICFQVSATGYAQRINLSEKNVPVKKVLAQIKKQSGYIMFYESNLIGNDEKVNVTLTNATIKQALDEVLEKLPLSYSIVENTIVINKKEGTSKLILPVMKALTVAGKVTDIKGTALPGVTVKLKGSAQGTNTDANGNYHINIPDDGILIFSFVGFVQQEIESKGRTSLDVVMTEQPSSLNELVVVGYGAVKKRDLTGAVSTIKTPDVQTMPVSSIDQTLQGQAAGLQVTQASGAPGSSTIIRIRGGNSINGGNEPLFVIDGIPVSSGSAGLDAGAVRSPSLNALSLINPNDIGSIEILKDASATAIYGSRGANGVILITTKRGKGKAKITLDSYNGWQEARNIPQMLNAPQYAAAVNSYNTAMGKDPEYTQANIDALGTGTNWMDQILRTAPVSSYQLSVRGSDSTLAYSLAGGYFDQEGIIKNSGLKRYSLNLNLDKKVNKRLTINNNSILSYIRNSGVISEGGYSNTGVSSAIYTALQYDPTASVWDSNGDYNFSPRMESSRLSNPLALVEDVTNQSKVVRILENVSAVYAFTKDLSLKVSGGADFLTSKEQFYEGRSVIEGRDNNGLATLGSFQDYSFLNENTLNYTKNIGGVHQFNILAGFTAQTDRVENMTSSSKGFTNDILGAGNLGAGSGTLPATSNIVNWALVSYLARVNYAYKDKYLFTATARYDGSSRFGEDNKLGFFPSFAFAWRLSNEPFMQNMSAVSNAKLRASYGVTGNQAVSPYSSLQQLAVSKTIFGDEVQIGLSPGNIANQQLGWEQTAQADIGLDIGLFHDKLLIVADAYRKVTSDLLLNVTLPYSTGFSSSLQNMGKLSNQGVELGISTTNEFGAFKWNAGLNLSYNKNKLLNIGSNNKYFVSLNEGDSYGDILVEPGQPIGNFYGYVSDGIFKNADEVKNSAQPLAVPGDRRFKDISGPDGKPDGQITDMDRTIIGNSQPKWIYGFSNQLDFKGFELSFLLQGVQGNSIYNVQKMYYENFVPNTNASVAVLNAWTPENPNSDIPRIGTGQSSLPTQLSSHFLEDGSYLRLKNVTLGYNFSPGLLRKLSVGSLRVYVSGQDLLTITGYSGFDPEVSRFGQNNLTQGVDLGGYPRAKTYTIGLILGL